MHQLGGLMALTVTLRNQHADLRAIAYEALGLCCKHKVKVQLEALRLGVLDKAMEALEHDEDDTVRAKALYCLSGAPRGPIYRPWFACCRDRHSRQLCRPCTTGLLSDSPVALRVFAQRHGWRSIVAAMGSESQRMRRKAVFFTLAHCTDEDNMLAAELAGVIPSLARFLADDHIDLREHSQAALLQLVQSSSKRLSKAREEGLAVAEVRRCDVPLCVASSADVRVLP